MKVVYKDKGNRIVYTKGMTQDQIIEFIKNRMAKRQKELDKRQWIVDEYRSLSSKQAEDNEWLSYLINNPNFILPVDNQ